MKYSIQHIIFEATQECNLSCLYCYNHWRRKDQVVAKTSFKTIQKTLKQIFNTINFQHITFTGGEPLLTDGLEELVLKCRMKGKGVSVISNGTTGTFASYSMLKNLGVSLFEIPFHSVNPKIHDTLTGCSGSHEKVMKSINILKEIKAELCLVCVVTSENIECFQKTIETAHDLGVKRLMLARFNIGGRGICNAQRLLPSHSELKSVFSIANDFVKKNSMTISSNVCVPFCIIDPKEYPNVPISSCGSDMTRRPVTIDPFGNLRICNHSPINIGNLHSDTMSSILSSRYVKSWQTARPDYCSECNKWTQCRGGCRAASEQLGKTLENEDPIISIMNH